MLQDAGRLLVADRPEKAWPLGRPPPAGVMMETGGSKSLNKCPARRDNACTPAPGASCPSCSSRAPTLINRQPSNCCCCCCCRHVVEHHQGQAACAGGGAELLKLPVWVPETGLQGGGAKFGAKNGALSGTSTSTKLKVAHVEADAPPGAPTARARLSRKMRKALTRRPWHLHVGVSFSDEVC